MYIFHMYMYISYIINAQTLEKGSQSSTSKAVKKNCCLVLDLNP